MSQEDPARNSGRALVRESFAERGGLWVVAQFLAVAGWLVLTPIGRTLSDSVPLRLAAAGLIIAGALIGVLGARVLGKSRTPFPKPPQDAQLVQRGIYGVVRHPLYASLIALSFGWACLWGSALGAVLALLQAALLDAKARREERWLRGKFPEYAEYAARVQRLIPWIY